MTNIPSFDHPLSRVISFLLAAGLSIFILIAPQALVNSEGESHHGLLMLLLAGISFGFVHGVGFNPQNPVWRILFSPVSSWPIISFGLYFMLTP